MAPSARLLGCLRGALVVAVAAHWLPERAFSNTSPGAQHRLWPRSLRDRGARSARCAAPWDALPDALTGALFGKEAKVVVPTGMDEVVQEVQDHMMTSIEQGLPRIDMELPPGLRLGIDGKKSKLRPPTKELTQADVAMADREFAAAFVLMFHGLQNSANLCILFRTQKLALAARKDWGDFGNARVASFPSPKSMGDRTAAMAKAIQNRPYIVAVAPRGDQLRDLKELELQEDAKMCLVMLNPRLRCRRDKSELQESTAAGSNPAFHLSLVGRDGQAILYRRLSAPWVLVPRDMPKGEKPPELLRSETEPTAEEIEAVLAQYGLD